MSNEIEHLRDLMDERDKRYEQRFQATEKETVTTKVDLQARLDILNELRGGVATTSELDALEKIIDALRTQIVDIRERQSAQAGRGAGMTAGWGILIGFIMVAVAIVTVVRGG
jgi:hypothetical protein